MRINEIFYSLQGESTYSGLPFTLVRLTGCNLRCSYCDTEYAFHEGRHCSAPEVASRVMKMGPQPVLVTGGEPLLQDDVYELMALLLDAGYKVLLETGGSISVAKVDPRVVKILDVKCPSSGESQNNLWENFEFLSAQDEVKFVIGNEDDYQFAKEIAGEHQLADRCTILFSPVFNIMDPRDLADWILRDHLPFRLQIQLHKFLWPEKTRGC